MKVKIEIADSNGLRQAQCLLNKIKSMPYYNRVASRTKAWLKVKNAIDHWDETLIAMQTETPKSLFNYESEVLECGEESYNDRLNRGFAMMGQEE